MATIPVLGRRRLKHIKFKVRLGYMVRTCLKQMEKNIYISIYIYIYIPGFYIYKMKCFLELIFWIITNKWNYTIHGTN